MEANNIKIAQILGDFGTGGVESLIMNYYLNMPKNIVFDFFAYQTSKNIPYDLIEKYGGKIILLPSIKNVIKYKKVIYDGLKKGNYDIVQSNLNSLNFLSLKMAKKAGIKIRISNCLSSTNKREGLIYVIKSFLKLFSKKYATHYFACSDLAGKWLFGNKVINKSNYFKIYNAVDENRLKFDVKKRNLLVDKYNLQNKFIIGSIGRLEKQKNQKFLIEIFSEIIKVRKDAYLIIIGDGSLHSKLLKQINKNGLKDNVKIITSEEVGVRGSARDFYNVFDVFVLPSIYEGLPMVGIEAQINQLPCFFSSEITNETQITNNCVFIDLSCSAKEWMSRIINSSKERKTNFMKIEEYDIEKQAIRLANTYKNIIKGEKKI